MVGVTMRDMMVVVMRAVIVPVRMVMMIVIVMRVQGMHGVA